MEKARINYAPWSFSVTIIWYLQAFIYIHHLNISSFKVITDGLEQMVPKP